MEIKRGTVVRSNAGHDRGLFMAVLEVDGRSALTADGKTRTIISPKRKNLIHLSPTAAVLSDEEMESDSSLRKALRRFQAK
ncbi:MAG: KOW domain-containing RNA-binding protein [Oscillospiraceae bacterium]|nr:KOW domain-containing RNA-binding protein [Oscillospiraceae bacterium]